MLFSVGLCISALYYGAIYLFLEVCQLLVGTYHLYFLGCLTGIKFKLAAASAWYLKTIVQILDGKTNSEIQCLQTSMLAIVLPWSLAVNEHHFKTLRKGKQCTTMTPTVERSDS